MDPQSNNDQGLNVPQPQPGGAATMPLPAPAQAPPLSTSQLAHPPVLQPTVPVHPVGAQPTAGQGTARTDSAGLGELPAEAADSDVIEKEWVMKAKQIVGETRHDPYKQVRELNKLKADYMKKRYNKELKLPDA